MEIAYQHLKQNILDGIYKPSQKLTEHELSEKIGVSRNTIKKALLKLEQENLVQIESNKGAFIKSFTLDEVINYLEIREVLEGLAVKTTATNISETELEKMRDILNQMGNHIENNRFDEYSSLNKEFHNIIYNSSKNREAVEMINVIKNQLLRYHFRTILVPGRNKSSYEEHKNIIAALEARDEKKAEEAIKKHISNVRQTVEQNFSYLL